VRDPLDSGAGGGPTHPRDRFRQDRIEAPAAAFIEAVERGRLHHAWLLMGPRGVGKASFAYRCARRLLGAQPADEFGPLGSAPSDVVSRLVSSQSHPDLIAIERPEGKRDIPVDEARRLPEFFAKAPALGAFRVAIVDAAEDLNASGANALLKTLEEPSGRGVLFLVTHAPGRLLPTIRSRCRPLRFRPWAEEEIAERLTAEGVDPERALALAAQAHGSPGRALTLAAGAHPDLDAAIADLMSARGAPDALSLARLCDSFRGDKGLERLRYLFDRLADEARLEALRREGSSGDRWATAFERLLSLLSRTEGLNLDRGEALFAAAAEIAWAGRGGPG
jgi:DNA polymerase-3 subunit delta'